MISTLKDHPIWHSFAQTLKQLDLNQIAIHHLQACNAQINGYWDEDEFYETIRFSQMPHPELISSSLGVSQARIDDAYWLQLKFALTASQSTALEQADTKTTVGELTLILDENLEVFDENWLIDVHSPYVLKTQ